MAKRGQTAAATIDELTDYAEKNYAVFPQPVIHRIAAILVNLNSKSITSDSSGEIGDLLATLTELIKTNSNQFVELCDTIATLCIDREYVSFSDETINTIVKIIILHLEGKTHDPTSGLRALSSILYHNTLRLKDHHEAMINLCITLSKTSEEACRRACTVFGNISAFSQKSLPKLVYSRSVKFLMQAVNNGGTETVKSALRSLQLLVLDAPMDTYDLQAIVHTTANLAFREKPVALKFESVMVLKALAGCTQKSFYATWPFLLTKSPSVFDLLKQNPRIAKAAADLLADMFRGAWSYMQIANNIEETHAFTYLSAQVGEVIDISFHRFLSALEKTPKTDALVFQKIATAFSVFVKGCSFDNGRLKKGYVQKIINWGKKYLKSSPEEILCVLKSLLWTSIDFPEFRDNFDFLFNAFLNSTKNSSQEAAKISAIAMRRIAYAYTDECVSRWNLLAPWLRTLSPQQAFLVIVRFAENHVTDLNIWEEILNYHVPAAFEANHPGAIQLALKCIGETGFIFEKLSDGLQRQCLSTILGCDQPEALDAVGKLALSRAPDYSDVFLTDACRKLLSCDPPAFKPLAKVLEAYSNRKIMFPDNWIIEIVGILDNYKSPYIPKCWAMLLSFLPNGSSLTGTIIDSIINVLISGAEPSWRWKAAAALGIAFSFNIATDEACTALLDALRDSRSPKIKVRAAESLAKLKSRVPLAGQFAGAVSTSLDLLLESAHFTFLKLSEQRRLDGRLRTALTKFFFQLLIWATPRDFNALEECLVANVDAIFDLMEHSENAPWESITTLYELKFTSIPSSTLEKFQQRAFPV